MLHFLLLLTSFSPAGTPEIRNNYADTVVPYAEGIHRSAPAPKRDFKTITPQKYVQTLAEGDITLTKYYLKSGENSYNIIYSITPRGGQAETIRLNKQYFDQVFQQRSQGISSKWELVSRRLTDKKMDVTDEKTWVELIHYYNNL